MGGDLEVVSLRRQGRKGPRPRQEEGTFTPSDAVTLTFERRGHNPLRFLGSPSSQLVASLTVTRARVV